MTTPSSPMKTALACSFLLLAVAGAWAAESAIPPVTPAPLDEGIALFEAGEDEAAASFFARQTAARPRDAEAAYYLGRVHYKQNQAEESVQWLVKATDLAADNSDYQLWLGRAYLLQLQTASMFSKLGLSKKVRAHFGRAIELDPDNFEAREYLAGYYFEAPFVAGGSTAKGMEQLTEIRQRDPLRGHLVLGSHYHGEKKYDLAEKEFRTALEFKPGPDQPSLAWAQYRLGLVYAHKGDIPRARESYEMAVKLDSEHDEAKAALKKLR